MILFLSGGILLGPSAIGRNKNYLETIFPEKSLPLISVVANLGLVLYLFIVGMELGKRQCSRLKTFVKKRVQCRLRVSDMETVWMKFDFLLSLLQKLQA